MDDARASGYANQLDVSVAWDDHGCVLAIGGELDVATEGVLADALTAALEVTDELTVDMERVTFADAAGLALLTRSARSAAGAGKRMTVRNWPRSVELIADVAPGVDQWLHGAPPDEGRV